MLQRTSLGTGSVDLEDTQSQMDLALNANFDIGGLFDYNWSVDEPNSVNATAAAAPLHGNIDSENNEASDDDAKANQDVSLPDTYDNSSGTNGTLHPHAIPSSAECPPVALAALDSGGNGARSSSHSQNQGGSGTDAKPGVNALDRNPLAVPWNASMAPSLTSMSANVAASNPMTAGAFFLPGAQALTAAPMPSSTEGAPPPFLLFDAPIELRANFIASQRAQGFPTLDDNNSFHYQRHQQPIHQNVMAPRLIDGRHGGIGSKRVKNEREQKRTQKITDLIDQLRDKMEEGGWKVGGTKSKYATLSTYVYQWASVSFCYFSRSYLYFAVIQMCRVCEAPGSIQQRARVGIGKDQARFGSETAKNRRRQRVPTRSVGSRKHDLQPYDLIRVVNRASPSGETLLLW
jgi:hypothetical protein